jgi:hypothetical protein
MITGFFMDWFDRHTEKWFPVEKNDLGKWKIL